MTPPQPKEGAPDSLTPEKVAELQEMGELLSKWGLALDGVTVVAKSMGRKVPKELFRASLTVGDALPSLLEAARERDELLVKVEAIQERCVEFGANPILGSDATDTERAWFEGHRLAHRQIAELAYADNSEVTPDAH